MGSDYNRVQIANWEIINGTMVPIDEYGHYLDWHTVSEDKSTAMELTSPYGHLEYVVGGETEDGGDFMTCFDFAELPDGRIVLHAVVNSDSGGFIEGAGYLVVSKINAVRMAQGMTDEAMDALAANEMEHDQKGWNQSPCYFWRSVHAHVAQNGPAIRIPVEMKRRPINTRNYL